MSPGLGSLSKLAVRVEGAEISGTGLVSAGYPTSESTADAEEVLLKSSDQVAFLSEGVNEDHAFELDETLIGTPAVSGMDRVGLMGGGSVEVQGMYDGLDALIAAALGFENPEAAGSPIEKNSTALTSSVTVGNDIFNDSGSPYVSTDVGKFIRQDDNAREGGVRRIITYTSATQVCVTPNWDTGVGAIPVSGDGATMSDEFEHTFELAPRLADELFADLDDLQNFTYPTAGIGTATDQIIRRLTVGILKQSTTPWVWRSCMVNG
ncbi:hypothetical protein LCGC14_1842930, partial [marine sediment metagenome]